MNINIIRYILVPVPEVPGGGGGPGLPNKSLAGLWPNSFRCHLVVTTGAFKYSKTNSSNGNDV